MLARGGGRQRIYCFICHATPTHSPPPKKRKGKSEKESSWNHVHYFQLTPLKPLNSLLSCSCSSSGRGQHYPVLWELVIWFNSDPPACLALRNVIPVNSVFKWLQANWYHLSGKAPPPSWNIVFKQPQLSPPCVTRLWWGSRNISFYSVILFHTVWLETERYESLNHEYITHSL